MMHLEVGGDFEDEFLYFSFKDLFGGLRVVLHFPVPGVDVPDGAGSLRLLHQLITNLYLHSRVFSN